MQPKYSGYRLMRFLDRLEQGHIHYTLARHRDEALMVSVSVPGAHWEVESARRERQENQKAADNE